MGVAMSIGKTVVPLPDAGPPVQAGFLSFRSIDALP
jgi:hypothetical protein